MSPFSNTLAYERGLEPELPPSATEFATMYSKPRIGERAQGLIKYWFDADFREVARKVLGFRMRVHDEPIVWGRDNLVRIGLYPPFDLDTP